MGFFARMRQLVDRGQSAPKPAADARALPAWAARSYDGASLSPGRGAAWRYSSATPNDEVSLALPILQARSRDLVRNNPYAASAIGALVTDLVGTGIHPRIQCDRDADERRMLDAWDAWADECYTSGRQTLYSLQAVMIRGWLESGESLVRRHPRRASAGLTVPLQLEILESDLLDASRSDLGLGASDLAGRTIAGVQHDALGRIVAYWLHPQHPGGLGMGLGSAPVPADHIAHLYEMLRPSQVRGVPWLSPVLWRIRELDGYQDAESVRKRMEACIGTLVSGGQEADLDDVQGRLTQAATDSTGAVIESLYPGMIGYLPSGMEVKTVQPTSSGGYEEHARVETRAIAIGARMTYERLSGDLSSTNYSSIRAGLRSYEIMLAGLQELVIRPLFLAPVWSWWYASALAAGRIPAVPYKVRWGWPTMGLIDRAKEAAADVAEIRGGLASLSAIHARRGLDSQATVEEIARDFARLDAAGLVLDCDPRRATKSGIIQADDTTGGPTGTPPQEGNDE